jgi:hypothetical protein
MNFFRNKKATLLGGSLQRSLLSNPISTLQPGYASYLEDVSQRST